MDAMTAFLHDLKKCEKFNRTEERALWEQMNAGDLEAKEMLVKSVLPLAFSVTKRIARDLEDASLDACEGALAAVEHFQPSKGRLTTYTTIWARQVALRQRFRHSHAISLPEWLRGGTLEVRRALEVDAVVQMSSLDAVIAHEGNTSTNADILPCPRCGLPEDVMVATELLREDQNKLLYSQWLLTKLDYRTRNIILDRNRGDTLMAIGDRIGLTRERVRQLESDGKQQLAILYRKYPYKNWMDGQGGNHG
jgi:RNA polymerase sigma factor (sigma-70 family)